MFSIKSIIQQRGNKSNIYTNFKQLCSIVTEERLKYNAFIRSDFNEVRHGLRLLDKRMEQ